MEVGCGRGPFALWAALHGAADVLGIEPEVEGSTSGSLAAFRAQVKQLGLTNIRATNQRLEELEDSHSYDLIILFNVINHLDEDAVQRLHNDPAARQRYAPILAHLRRLLAPHGVLIVADCARSNLWGRLGLRSPFAPTIAWHKHQDPPVWKELFESSGFRLRDVRWSPLHPLGRLTSNALVNFLTASHFVLRFTAH